MHAIKDKQKSAIISQKIKFNIFTIQRFKLFYIKKLNIYVNAMR